MRLLGSLDFIAILKKTRRQKISFLLHAVASDRTVPRFTATGTGCSGSISLRRPRQVAGRFWRGRRNRPLERLLSFTIDAPLSVEDFCALRIEMSVKLREKIAVLSPKQLSEARGSRSYGRVLDNAGNEFPGPGSYCQRN